MAAPAVGDFRRRLLDGLAASIEERGYRETTVADIVRCARTSKRTFYDHFSGKEECFLELVSTKTDDLVVTLTAAVDPEAPWQQQVRQAMTAYVGSIHDTPAITLSWIRELPALGDVARPTVRRGFSQLSAVLIALSGTAGFQRAGIKPMTPAAAVMLVGGLRELTAQTLEDGGSVTAMIEPAVAAATALVGGG